MLRKQRGQGLLEFALILPALLWLSMGIIEVGYVFIVYTSLFNAAREGTRFGAVNPWSPADIAASARSRVFFVDPAAVDVEICCDDGPGTDSFYCDQTPTTPALCGGGTGSGEDGKAGLGQRVVMTVTHDIATITPVIQPLVPSFPVAMQSARTIVSLGEFGLPPPGAVPGPDGDLDGMPDSLDVCPGYNDYDDADGDGVPDGCDNCPYVDNSDQADSNGNLVGDACDATLAVITLSVTADPVTVNSGSDVAFTYTVQNPGSVDVAEVTVNDSFGNSFDLGMLAAGASAVVTWNETVYATMTNNVVATGVDMASGGAVSDSDNVMVTVLDPGGLDLTVAVDPGVIYASQSVTLTYEVTNIGAADLTGVVVTDTLGNACNFGALAPLGSALCRVHPVISQSTAVYVVATGTTNPGGQVVGDGEFVNILVVMEPIEIGEPLIEGVTVVTGTAQAGETLVIRDLMDDGFPSPAGDTTVVEPDGTFSFAGLTPLAAGHVIVVEGYGQWDAAVVEGPGDAPIEIVPPEYGRLCHGDTVVRGTAEPAQTVTLAVTDTASLVYEDHVTVNALGAFLFQLPLPLQDGQEIAVTGYGESDLEIAGVCTDDPYISISPQCGNTSPLTITVNGYQWSTHVKDRRLDLYWDDVLTDTFLSQNQDFTVEIVVDATTITSDTHTVRAEVWWKDVTLESVAEAPFLSPCPAPNLVVTNLSLITGAPISTYQSLAFLVEVANTGVNPANNLFWVDLSSTVPMTGAWAAVSTLGVGETTLVTVPFESGFLATGPYPITATVDSMHQVTELLEDDNQFGGLEVTVTAEGTPPPLPPVPPIVGYLTGETWITLSGPAVPHGRALVEVREGDAFGALVASLYSGADGGFGPVALAPGSDYAILARVWMDGTLYTGTLGGVEVLESDTTTVIIVMHAL